MKPGSDKSYKKIVQIIETLEGNKTRTKEEFTVERVIAMNLKGCLLSSSFFFYLEGDWNSCITSFQPA